MPARAEFDTTVTATGNPEAGAFFAKLSNSLQRYHVDTIEAAKTAETRQRRVEKLISLFRAGRKR